MLTLTNTNKKTNQHEQLLLYPEISYTMQGCFFEIRNQYGPGQKEIVYQRVLEEKLTLKKLKTEREKRLEVFSQDTGKVVGVYQLGIFGQFFHPKIIFQTNHLHE